MIKWKSIYQLKEENAEFPTQHSRKVITWSFDDLQHIVYAQIKIIISTHICCKIEQISKNNMKSVKQASIAH